MNLKAMMLGSNAFYQKLLQCINTGITRLEFSNYFYSYQEQVASMDATKYQY
jgi:hypothetical protein